MVKRDHILWTLLFCGNNKKLVNYIREMYQIFY